MRHDDRMETGVDMHSDRLYFGTIVSVELARFLLFSRETTVHCAKSSVGIQSRDGSFRSRCTIIILYFQMCRLGLVAIATATG